MSIRLRQAMVRVTRDKAVYALPVAALGLALGAVICALSFAHLVVLQPLPYPEQARLVIAKQHIFDHGESTNSGAFSYPAVALLQAKARDVFTSSVIMDFARDVVVSHPAQPLVSVNYVTDEYAELFAPPMVLGRFPSAKVEVDKSHPVAVISFSAWQTLFDRRADVLGKTVRTAAGVDFEVVGVTARSFVEPEFNGPGHRTSVWLPWEFNPSPRHWGWAATTETLTLAGRLAPGVENHQAAVRLSLLLSGPWRAEQTATAQAGWSTQVELMSAQRAIVGEGYDAGLLMLAGTLGLILVVLVNIIHLLVAKVAERSREFSIQLALGAERKQLFALILSDMLLLMLPAAVLAVAVAAAGFALMQRYLQAILPRIEELSVGLSTAAVAISSAAMLAIIISGIALASCGAVNANGALNTGRQNTVSQVSRQLRAALMASQVAVAGLLIAIHIGLLRDAHKILSEPGIDLERSASAFLYQSASVAPGTALAEQPFAELKRRLAQLPGVEKVSQSHSPLQDFIKTAVATRSGTLFPVDLKRIDDEYLTLTGQRLAMGRNFSAAEISSEANVVLINASLARMLERDGKTVGDGVLGIALQRGTEAPYLVVGIVDELAYPGALATDARIYLPASTAGSNLIIKFQQGFSLSREQLVAWVAGINPGLGVFLYDDLSQQRSDILLPRRITAIAAAAIALIVIVVSGIGLFGMVSYTTRLRRSEIGARLAFGARARHIVAMLISNNLLELAIGCLSSAAFAWLALPSLQTWLDMHGADVRWMDAMLALGLLAICVVMACYLSAESLLSQSSASALRHTGQ